ncbi:hypothetical protein C4D60_Mb10t22650 [Musa balbisiana]|uniref:Uncharacterized protein n=1 Tax=Musa balbisiana TaxID=52838 RepID=A0A4S8IZ30_MUSBA|nr:hypothetical protein C4D60_Mb10t22650 [Musa balbisiana]
MVAPPIGAPAPESSSSCGHNREEKETRISIFLAMRSGKKFHGLLSPVKGNSVGRTALTTGTLVDAEPTNQTTSLHLPFSVPPNMGDSYI